MKRKIFVVLIVLLAAVMMFAACNSGNGGSYAPGDGGQGDYDDGYGSEDTAVQERKIIYSARLSVECANVNDAMKAVKGIMTDDEWAVSEYISDANATLYLRIRSDRLDEFTDAVSALGKVMNYSKEAQDISDSYYDYTGQIEALEAQRAKLIALIADTNSLHEIIMLEEKLSQIERELAHYQRIINNYDSRLEYSTVQLYLTEKYVAAEDPTFGEKTSKTFKGSWKALGTFFEYLVLAIIAVFPFLLVIVPVGIAVFFISKHVKKKRKLKKGAAADASATQPNGYGFPGGQYCNNGYYYGGGQNPYFNPGENPYGQPQQEMPDSEDVTEEGEKAETEDAPRRETSEASEAGEEANQDGAEQ